MEPYRASLFAFMPRAGGKPLIGRECIIQLIAATSTETGLDLRCWLDESRSRFPTREWLPSTSPVTTCQVIDVFNLGDEGGIACSLDIGGPEAKNAHIVSITHLIFDRRSPLFREIDAYQRRRVKKLKQHQGRSVWPPPSS